MAQLVGHDKVYSATIDLGHKSDTRDADYHEIYESVPVDVPPTLEAVEKALQSFVPWATLPVPSFSAKKQQGRRMYKDARAGKVHDVSKDMQIMSVELLEYAFPFVKIRCHVGSGTFIRSMAYSLGEKLGTGGIIAALRRERSGEYSITDAQCIPEKPAEPQNS